MVSPTNKKTAISAKMNRLVNICYFFLFISVFSYFFQWKWLFLFCGKYA
jgi:hypothetical protein